MPIMTLQGLIVVPAPDYCPPAFKYKDADEITIVPGRYFPMGHRLDGQYQNLGNLGAYFDVSAAFGVDVDDAANLVGGDVISSWYSLFMTGASTVKVAPFIRVDTIDYNVSHAGKTTINPADHDLGTSANDYFVSADDVFNGHRLLLLSDTANHGEIFTIEDCVNGTPDEIVIDGDQTSLIAATEWLQMIPASGTPCVYLGCIRLDASGNLRWFKKTGWNYQLPGTVDVWGNYRTSPANTELGPALPPTATRFLAGLKIVSGTGATGLAVNIYRGIAGSDICEQTLWSNMASAAWLNANIAFIPLSAVAKIRNSFQIYTGSWVEANEGHFLVTGFEE